LAEYLHKKGWALRNLASLPHISVAGAISTGTHGSGIKIGNLSSAVSGLEIVKASGEVVELSRKNNPDLFSGSVVSLGCLGVLTKITLDILPTFMMRQDVYENLSFDTLQNRFEEIMNAGYSVSLFTDWQNRNFSEVWIKSKVESGKTNSMPQDFFGAKPAKQNLHPIRRFCRELH
jgi:xylitol oxidase